MNSAATAALGQAAGPVPALGGPPAQPLAVA